jgi:hypothetical protein
LAVLHEINKALVDAFNGLEEFINADGFASYFVGGEAGGYGIAELGGAADTFSSQQRKHGEGILVARLAFLPLLNGPGSLAHIIHGIAKFPEDARIERARTHLILEPDQVGAGLL